MVCAGSVAASEGLPDSDSDASREGTAAHALAEHVLKGGNFADLFGQKHENGQDYTYDMVQAVGQYTARVQELVKGTGGALFVEVKLPIGHITGEAGAHGTSDAVVCADRELIVVDLKFGRGVQVLAEENRQAMIYALAALDEFDMTHGPFEVVRIVIDMPRKGGANEWVVSVEDLEKFRAQVAAAALATDQPDAPRVVSEKGCRWCKAKATCPTLAAEVAAAAETPVDADAETLGRAMALVPIVEGWAKAVKEATGERLRAGDAIPGFKLVQGRKGARQWTDAAAAETFLRSVLKKDECYTATLISPTDCDAFVKAGRIGPRRQKTLDDLITQADAGLVVAPESDKRAAVSVAREAPDDAFEDLTQGDPGALDPIADLI